MEGGRATDDKPTIFRYHAPPIKEENMKENQIRWQKLIYYHRKTLHTLSKMCHISHTLALLGTRQQLFSFKNY